MHGPTFRRRALFLVGGVVVGLLAITMARLADLSQMLFASVAGRFWLAEGDDPSAPHIGRLPGYVEQFEGQERSVELKGFSRDEARSYLEHERGLANDLRLGAIVRKGAGNPFNLALLADVVEGDSTVTAETIDAYPDADLVYLIERIVKR